MIMAMVIILIAAVTALLLFIFFVASATSQKSNNMMSDQYVRWSVYDDEELQSYLPHQKIAAIKRYRDLTGQGLKESKEAVEFMIANPDGKKGKRTLATDTGGAGVRDLLQEGRVDEAIDVYAAFMGVDEFTARDAINDMQREIEAEAHLSDPDYDNLRDLVSNGNMIQAIKQYMDATGSSLKDARRFIETEL